MNELIRLDAFQQALAEASTIPEVKNLLDQSDLFRQWLKKQKVGREAQNQGAIMCLQAQRRLGEMLGGVESEQGKRTDLTWLHDVTKLQEYEPDKVKRHRWQKLAEIPEFVNALTNLPWREVVKLLPRIFYCSKKFILAKAIQRSEQFIHTILKADQMRIENLVNINNIGRLRVSRS